MLHEQAGRRLTVRLPHRVHRPRHARDNNTPTREPWRGSFPPALAEPAVVAAAGTPRGTHTQERDPRGFEDGDGDGEHERATAGDRHRPGIRSFPADHRRPPTGEEEDDEDPEGDGCVGEGGGGDDGQPGWHGAAQQGQDEIDGGGDPYQFPEAGPQLPGARVDDLAGCERQRDGDQVGGVDGELGAGGEGGVEEAGGVQQAQAEAELWSGWGVVGFGGWWGKGV